jgi:hypothetical protein
MATTEAGLQGVRSELRDARRRDAIGRFLPNGGPKALDMKALEQKAYDIDAVRSAVDDAATLGGATWLSYLFTLFYLGIAAGGVTHTDILLETPVKLPFPQRRRASYCFFLPGTYSFCHRTLICLN